MMISQFLDTVGDGSGTINANGDYSSAAEEFLISPAAETDKRIAYKIYRMVISAEDTNGMQAQEYGNLGAALTNGVTIVHDDGSMTITNLTPTPIKTNALWGSYCYDVDVKSWGSGNELLVVRWTFSKSGAPITLANNERLVVGLNDDFSGLISHGFMVQGQKVT